MQASHAKVVCPTFWDRPPSVAAFSRRAFSLTTAMQSLRFDRESGGYISTHRLISIYRFLKAQSYMQTLLLAYQTQGIL